MSTLIHILGADIAHHNQTVLRFFNDQLAADNEQARHFMLVSGAMGDKLNDEAAYPALTIRRFADQASLARAVLASARANRRQRFLLHGQFNKRLWLALLTGALAASQVSWHVWGADLYETAGGIKNRLFYWLRRRAQRHIGRVFATHGDLHYFRCRKSQAATQLLYFPTRMPALPPAAGNWQAPDAPLTILLGNSGDPSNRHLAALRALRRQFADPLRLIIPMGYPSGNAAYIQRVAQAADGLFGSENVQILRESLAFDDYLALLRQCDLGYFLFERQQGVGTLCLLTQANIPCVLSRHNPFWRDMQAQKLPVLFSDQPLDMAAIKQAHLQLLHADKTQIAFFYPGYLPLWHQALLAAAGARL